MNHLTIQKHKVPPRIDLKNRKTLKKSKKSGTVRKELEQCKDICFDFYKTFCVRPSICFQESSFSGVGLFAAKDLRKGQKVVTGGPCGDRYHSQNDEDFTISLIVKKV